MKIKKEILLEKIPLSPKQSLGEEIANSITHGTGVGLSIAALVILVVFAAQLGDAWKVVGFSIYGAMLIIMFLSSTLYHAFHQPMVKRFFRILDHSSICLDCRNLYSRYNWRYARRLGLDSVRTDLGTYPDCHQSANLCHAQTEMDVHRDVCLDGLSDCHSHQTPDGKSSCRPDDLDADWRCLLPVGSDFLRLEKAALAPSHLAFVCTGWRYLPFLRNAATGVILDKPTALFHNL